MGGAVAAPQVALAAPGLGADGAVEELTQAPGAAEAALGAQRTCDRRAVGRDGVRGLVVEYQTVLLHAQVQRIGL